MGKYKNIILLIFLVGGMLLCSGCQKEQEETWKLEREQKNIKIALFGSEEYLGKEFTDGLKMAQREIKKVLDIDVILDIFDDQGDYNTGVSMATKIAKDSNYLMAITVQDFEIIDTAAEIFEKARKPFIVVDGCFDRTRENGYSYFISHCISAKKMGEMIGDYVIEVGIKKIASSHSGTIFEKDEIKGLQSIISATETKIYDMQIGPFSEEEFLESYNKWVSLGIEAIYFNHYSYTWGGELIQMLRDQGSKIKVMTDYSVNNEESLKSFGKAMEGAVIAPLYPIRESQRLRLFRERFKSQFSYQPTSRTIQIYDLIFAIVEAVQNADNSKGFMDYFKSKKGFEGVSGIVTYDSDGNLVPKKAKCQILKNGVFIDVENKK